MKILRTTGEAALGGASFTTGVQLGLYESGWWLVVIGVVVWLGCSVVAAWWEAQP